MANKKKKRFQFQLGWPGLIFSLGLLICLFLWMFVLGFYFGQRVVGNRVQKLSSPVSEKALSSKKAPPPVFEEVTPPPLAEKKFTPQAPKEEPPFLPVSRPSLQPQTPSPKPKKEKVAKTSRKTSPPKASSREKKRPEAFYSVQIASLRSVEEARKYVKYLQDKGYEAFFRKVVLPQKGTWYRIYVGRFKTISEARTFGEQLKKKEKLKAFYIQKLKLEK